MNTLCGRCFQQTVNQYGLCSACGYDNRSNRTAYPLALSAGSILCGRYIIGKVLGQGGFGITYMAQDYQTKEIVAIKEYFPDALATRTNATQVIPFSGERGENFAYGRSCFLEEARTMAQFNGNPNIAGIRLYFEENGTAYFVMEYINGCSFHDFIRSHGGRLAWPETAQIMLPVLAALADVHEKGIIHRDVTPDNIYLTKDGKIKLLDFGAARQSLGNVSRSLDVILKHGFAPKEQYSRRGRQGPFTDVYAASATIYYALTGTKPFDAIDREEHDKLPPPSVLGVQISKSVENAIMKGLAVKASDRYQNMGELYAALNPVTPGPVLREKSKQVHDATQKQTTVTDKSKNITPAPKGFSVKKLLIALAVGAVILLGIWGLYWLFHPHDYGDWVTIRQATCTQNGLRERTCFCGETEKGVIPVLDHEVVQDVGFGATCTEEGLSKGSHCAVCGKVLAVQTTVAAKGHSFSGNDCTRCDAKKWWAEFSTTQKTFTVGNRIQIDFSLRSNAKRVGTSVSGLLSASSINVYYKIDVKYTDGTQETGEKHPFNNGNPLNANDNWCVYWENGISSACSATLYIYDGSNHLLGSYSFKVTQ